jgi:hypothetical protein
MALELYENGNISIIKLYVIYILHKLIKNNNLIINLFISSNNSKFAIYKNSMEYCPDSFLAHFAIIWGFVAFSMTSSCL